MYRVDYTRREGYIHLQWGKIWFQALGTLDRPPLLVIHGGPGFPHDYLEPLGLLANSQPVIFYDQLGCGLSDQPDDAALWRIDRFVEELHHIRQALQIDQFHLLGHSWGTMVALEYALARPGGLLSLVFASPLFSVCRWLGDMHRLRKNLPQAIRETLDRHERAGTTDSDEYTQATITFYQHHVCRLSPWPLTYRAAASRMGLPTYTTMWGPNEFTCNGNLRDYDRTSRLEEVTLPTLLTCGRFDGATPYTVARYAMLIQGAEFAVFERSAHMAHLEEPEAYRRVLQEFLDRHHAV